MTRWHVLRMTRQGQQRAEVDCCRWELISCGGCGGALHCNCPRVMEVDIVQRRGVGRIITRIDVVSNDP